MYKKRIKFANREWLVIDNLEYEGVKFFYIIEDCSELINNNKNISYDDLKGKIDIEFIYKKSDDVYGNVTDPELFSKLLSIVGVKMMAESILEDMKK